MLFMHQQSCWKDSTYFVFCFQFSSIQSAELRPKGRSYRKPEKFWFNTQKFLTIRPDSKWKELA